MSGPVKHNPAYTAADIQRYLKGEMSAREMHELEKAALDDPFLADALEGFGTEPAADQHLADLHERLDARVRTTDRKPILMPWMRIAAAVILLVGLSVTAWYTLLNNRHSPLAQHREKAIATPPAAAVNKDTVTEADSSATAANVAAATPPPVAEKPAAAPPPAAVRPPAINRAEKKSYAKALGPPTTQDDTRPVQNAARPDSTSMEIAKTDKDFQTVESRVPGISLQKDTSTSHRQPMVFSGKVLDLHNNPIPGATLRFAGYSRAGTITDNQGYFKMNVYPQDSTLKVTIEGVGFQQQSLALNTINSETAIGRVIHLQPSASALDEVVVVGYGAKRRETHAQAPFESNVKTDSAWLMVRPIIGVQAYKDYLEANKKSIGADTSIHGTVIISFDVSRKGELTAFKVEQSLTPAHDAGVIHLISEGPAWKVSKGRSVHTAVRVVF